MSNAKTMSERFPNVRIHESTYVDEPVQIGEGTSIWHFCHILGEVTIGRHCSIGQNVMIGPRVTVGDNCKIQNNVSLTRASRSRMTFSAARAACLPTSSTRAR